MAATDPITLERPRFSIPLPRPLWIGLAAVVLIVVGVGLRIGDSTYRQQAAIREIDRLGGAVRTRNTAPTWLKRFVGDGPMQVFRQPYEAIFIENELQDSDLMHLAELTELEGVCLVETQTSDAGLVYYI